MQGRVAFLQECGFTQAQVLDLIERHGDILSRNSEYVRVFLQMINATFGCAQDMDAVAGVLLTCRRMGLFSQSVPTLQRNFSYFCKYVDVNDKELKRAWKNGLFTISPAELDIRLVSLAAQLSATLGEAKSVVRRLPQTGTLLPATVGLHVTQMHERGFSHDQVKSMCLRQPALLTFSYSSQVNVQKWAFLTCVLQLSHATIAARPHLLMCSLMNRLGPRWAYLQYLKRHLVIDFTSASQVVSTLVLSTDTEFRATHVAPELCPYDERFMKQWQMRWETLLADRQLNLQDIDGCADDLQVGFMDTLPGA